MAGKRITRAEFTRIKTLTEAGIKNVQISKVLGRDQSTISKMRNCATYEDYQRLNEKYSMSRKSSSRPEPRFVPTPAPTDGRPTTKEFLYTLNRIADGVEKLVGAWEAKGDKRRLF